MTAPWLFAPPEDWDGAEVTLPADESHHALKVLRIAPPDVVTLTDGRGTVARAAASRIVEGRLVAEVLERDAKRRLRPRINVYQGVAKGHKLDDVMQQLAGLGVASVTAFESDRSVARWDRNKIERLRERWEAIARAAAKQSRNAFVMETGAGLSFTELTRRVAREPLAIALWEEAALPLRTALVDGPDEVALVIGPEGGLTSAEAEALADAGAQLVSLGPLILRTEHAAAAAATAVLYHYGLIG